MVLPTKEIAHSAEEAELDQLAFHGKLDTTSPGIGTVEVLMGADAHAKNDSKPHELLVVSQPQSSGGK